MQEQEDGETHRARPARKVWNRPLRTLLGLAMVALIVAVSGMLVQLDYRRNRAEAIANAESAMHALSSRLVDRFGVIAANSQMPVTLISKLAAAFLAPPPDLMQGKIDIVREGLALAPNLDGIYVGFPDGAFFHAIRLASPAWQQALEAPQKASIAIRTMTAIDPDRRERLVFLDGAGTAMGERSPPASDFDPRQRPWYKASASSGETVSIGPYRMATTGALGMAIARAHRGNRQIVVGADVVIETILDFLDAERITPETAIFIANPDGRVVIHSDPPMMRRIDLERQDAPVARVIEDPLVHAVLEANIGDDPVHLTAGDQPYLVTARAIEDSVLLSGHRVFIAAPMNELLGPTIAALRQGLAVSAAIIAAAVVIALFLARLISRSLDALTASADRLKELDFATPIEVPTRISEIHTLGSAMNRARDAIHSFAMYVPKEFVRRGMESGRFSGRSARRQEVTALFTDIYDFTTISEKNAPEDVVAMLSDYFDIFSEVVNAHNGTIIQFLGDSVFAMWNAPVADEHHAERACRCALDVEQRLKQFNADQRDKGLPEFRTRYGIHTGQALVGSVGAEERLQYTAMGDTINLASRLEGMNKKQGTVILASEATVKRCGDAIVFRPLGATKAKGRTAAVRIYEVTGAAPETA
ncbi:adenylate/guanylate cyclase domain-containing protein [Mesorhizobium xinjiangense]|uniref:adenylate/guanylate cyclase domain-containing protein n=1 Tax=Mesorhizobium xinjiangense TaxID=2678685 RepID=UPI0012ED1ADB|nr:adenylate/guanylate cyclase domain-containing protein [Mesorhizobium xinjiangense]